MFVSTEAEFVSYPKKNDYSPLTLINSFYLILQAKPGTIVNDAIKAATAGGGGSYRVLHNNCNDVSARIIGAIQNPAAKQGGLAPRRRRKRRHRNDKN